MPGLVVEDAEPHPFLADPEAVLDYVGRMQGVLRLADWHVTLSGEPATCDEHEVTASISPTHGRKWATLYLSQKWDELKPKEQRHAVIHELLHLHAEPIQAAVRSVITELGSTAYQILTSQVDLMVEFAVDGIADALDELLPLPGEWTSHVWPATAPRWEAIVRAAEAASEAWSKAEDVNDTGEFDDKMQRLHDSIHQKGPTQDAASDE